MRYTDHSMCPTEVYPYNPNGSPAGIAAIVSDNGRHLAMMPHPERSYLTWQLQYISSEHQSTMKNLSPWFLMFRNAYEWSCAKKDELQKQRTKGLDEFMFKHDLDDLDYIDNEPIIPWE